MEENQQADAKALKQAVKRLFNTPDGELLRSYLKAIYVDGTSLGQTPELTYYRLGQKELVMDLLSVADSEEDNHEVQLLS